MNQVELSAPQPRTSEFLPRHRLRGSAGAKPARARRQWLGLAAAAFPLAASAIAADIELKVRSETALARPTIMAHEDRAVFSEDARHVAYPVGGREQRVCLDGVEGKSYTVVTNLTFSPDGRRLAYWAVMQGSVVVVVDGKEVKTPVLIGTSDQLLFSPDSRHLAFGGPVGGRRGVVVHDDRVGPVYAELGELRFSPDSQHFAHMATRADLTNELIVLDGREIPVPDAVVGQTFTFSPDGRRLAYGLGLPPQSRWVIDGQAGPVFTSLGDCYFSPDSQRLAYEARRGSEWVIVLDGREVATADKVSASTSGFSPDSRRFAIGLSRAGKGLLWVEGKELNAYDGLASRSVVFSPDSRRLAYAAFRTKADALTGVTIVDGQESPDWESADSMIFSPDSRHFAYWVKRRGEWRVVRDGAEGKAYQRPAFPLRFSADSRHLVTAALREDGSVVPVADGVEGPAFDRLFKLALDVPNRIRLLAQRRDAMLQKEWVCVELDIVTAPEAGHVD